MAVVAPRKVREIILGLTLLLVPLLFLQANLKGPTEINPVDRLVLYISSPIQSAITWITATVQSTWRRYVFLVGLKRESEQLRAENGQLRRDLREAQRNLARLHHYQRLLDFRQTSGVETLGAQVIGRQTGTFSRVLRVRIDRGHRAVQPGLPVVTADGVVGRIGRVYGGYSDVVLAVDPKSAVDVVIQRTGARGVLKGIDGSNRYLCRIDYLLHKEEVKVGDLVVTSGVAGVFPRNTPVGRVSRVHRQGRGLYQEVEVLPVVDFGALEDVLVILAPPPPAPSEVTARGAEKHAEPAQGVTP